MTNRRILLVEDQPDFAAVLAAWLRSSHFQVEIADNGLQAVAVATLFRPEVILLDIDLPALDGFNVCRRIREKNWGRDILIISITGLTEVDDCRFAESGFNRRLNKPVQYGDIEKLLNGQEIAAASAYSLRPVFSSLCAIATVTCQTHNTFTPSA